MPTHIKLCSKAFTEDWLRFAEKLAAIVKELETALGKYIAADNPAAKASAIALIDVGISELRAVHSANAWLEYLTSLQPLAMTIEISSGPLEVQCELPYLLARICGRQTVLIVRLKLWKKLISKSQHFRPSEPAGKKF